MCWDGWNGTRHLPTLDAALLSSSMAGADQGRTSDVESDKTATYFYISLVFAIPGQIPTNISQGKALFMIKDKFVFLSYSVKIFVRLAPVKK